MEQSFFYLIFFPVKVDEKIHPNLDFIIPTAIF